MKKNVLITGASSGMGREFARLLAKNNHSLIIVARRIKLLEELKTELESQYKVRITIEALNLNDKKNCYYLIDQYADSVDFLINNAGFGHEAPIIDMEWEVAEKMIDLNIVASSLLTKGFSAKMAAKGYGEILLVSSGGAVAPCVNASVYHATKAYVNMLGESLNYELKKHGVHLGILMPGFTKTEFFRYLGEEEKNLKSHMFVTPEYTVAHALKAMEKKKLIITPGKINTLQIMFLQRLVPTRLKPWFVDKVVEYTFGRMVYSIPDFHSTRLTLWRKT